MEDSICDKIPKIENAKDFLDTIKNKYKKVSKNEKNELLTTLRTTVYDGVSGIRNHIDKLVSCYCKIKDFGLNLDDDYLVWFIMGNLPLQFYNIRSSYNAQKENWAIEEMTTILDKEEDDIKKGRERTIYVITDSSSQKRKIPPKSLND